VHNSAPHHEGRWRSKSVSPCILNLSSKKDQLYTLATVLPGKDPPPQITPNRDSLDALKRKEACWKLTPNFVIYPIAQSQHSPSIQTQIIYVRVNNKFIPQVRGTKV